MRTLRRLGLIGVLVVPLVLTSAPAAHATTTAHGDAAFNGSAFLPKFPCSPPPPFGTGPCNGSFSGQWAGNLSGVAGTSPYAVTWDTHSASLPKVNASFSYFEFQCLASTELANGIAQGTGSAVADPGMVKGQWQVVGEPFARDIIGVTVTFSFQWSRVATAAVMTLSPATVQLNVSGLGLRTVSTAAQLATATFVPQQSTGSGVPSCANPLTNVTGLIAGALPISGVA